MAGRADSDERYVLDLCDEILGSWHVASSGSTGSAETLLPSGPAVRSPAVAIYVRFSDDRTAK